MIKKVQERFALTHLGAVNLIKACVSCTISYLAIAMSIGVLYRNAMAVQIQSYIQCI